MPPRFAYWTILIGAAPTAFRGATREELVPTLRQLQRKHPDAILRWFARGRVWDSPREADSTLRQEQQRAKAPARAPGTRQADRRKDVGPARPGGFRHARPGSQPGRAAPGRRGSSSGGRRGR